MGAIVEFMIFVMVALPRLPWLKPLNVISEWAAFALAALALARLLITEMVGCGSGGSCRGPQRKHYVAIFVGLVSAPR